MAVQAGLCQTWLETQTTGFLTSRLIIDWLLFFRSANLILNLFSLMVDANIPDIALEPDKTVKKVGLYFNISLVFNMIVVVCPRFFLFPNFQFPPLQMTT